MKKEEQMLPFFYAIYLRILCAWVRPNTYDV